MTGSLWYPSVEDVLDIHEAIVSEYPNTSPGVQSRGDIEFALEYISDGGLESLPETIHERAFHLLRLLVADHPFVDGNKRTALNSDRRFLSSQRLSIRLRQRDQEDSATIRYGRGDSR